MAGAKGSNPFAWEDPFLLEAQLGEEERMIRDTARAYVQEHLAPRVRKAFREEHTDPAIFEMGELGLLGRGCDPRPIIGRGLIFSKIGIVWRANGKSGRRRMRDRLKPAGETRAADVLHRMRADIISCALKPGAKLRFEGLRDMYAVSFSTLREALSRLVAEGLVIAEDQRGFVVAPVSIDDLNDLTYVRVLVERECLGLAIKHGNDDWEADIIGSFHRMDRLQSRLGPNYYLSEEWAKLHGDFHFSLVAACGSPNLLEIRQKLFERAHRYRRMSSQFRPQWRAKDVEHKMIMDSVIARDTAKAQELIDRHIRETTENVIKHAGHLFVAADDERHSRADHVAAE